MPFCPTCRIEYRPGFTACADCGTALVTELPPAGPVPSLLDQEMVSVHDAPDQLMAEAVAALLQEQGIDASVRSEQIAMYDGVAMMLRPRWGRVMVLEGDAVRARRHIAEYLASLESGAEDETAEQSQAPDENEEPQA